jgi:hypothetical protein
MDTVVLDAKNLATISDRYADVVNNIDAGPAVDDAALLELPFPAFPRGNSPPSVPVIVAVAAAVALVPGVAL